MRWASDPKYGQITFTQLPTNQIIIISYIYRSYLTAIHTNQYLSVVIWFELVELTLLHNVTGFCNKITSICRDLGSNCQDNAQYIVYICR